MSAPRVLLADDHVLFTEVLVHLLSSRYDVVDVVDNGRALQASCQKFTPDVIVTDVTMPLMNGLDAVRQLSQQTNPPKIVFLTMHQDRDLVRECFKCGGSAVVTKDQSYDELITAIETVLNNGSYISPTIAGDNDPSAFLDSASTDPLTPRQREILQLFAEGKTVKEIAGIMNLSTRTVEWHKYRMMHVLQARNNTDLIRHALKSRLVF